ncbi:hypothetical protein BC829DRAFT_438965 [Chytridium lagenaria]|nr:hypothetical protein BC829DRAFT_438965 [Chytridium lagenaria]
MSDEINTYKSALMARSLPTNLPPAFTANMQKPEAMSNEGRNESRVLDVEEGGGYLHGEVPVKKAHPKSATPSSAGLDYVGDHLAYFLGITQSRYELYLDDAEDYQRALVQEDEERERERVSLELTLALGDDVKAGRKVDRVALPEVEVGMGERNEAEVAASAEPREVRGDGSLLITMPEAAHLTRAAN